jgi:transcriptional regulator of PTS gene
VRISDQELNRQRVLKVIRRAEPVSRTEIVSLTGLGGGTITEIVSDLMSRQLLLEERSPAVGRGRPRVQLRLNPGAAHVVGAYLVPYGSLLVEIVNLKGERLYDKATPMPSLENYEELGQHLAAVIHDSIKSSPFRLKQIHSVGVGLPGMVDSTRGVLHWVVTMPRGELPIATIMSNRLKLPVVVDNVANLAARFEHWSSEDAQIDNLAMIIVGLGLGFGRYVEGEVWAGAHGMNGEFGHHKIALMDGAKCYCGARGCVAAYASMYGIVNGVCAARGRRPPKQSAIEEIQRLFGEFLEDARRGERMAVAAFDLAGRALGVGIANLINVSDPGRIVVLLLDEGLEERIVAPCRAAIESNTLPALRGRASMQFKFAPETNYAQGAATLVLERLYREG